MILINAEELHLGRRISPNSRHAGRIRSPKSLAPSQGRVKLDKPFYKIPDKKTPKFIRGDELP